MLGRGKMVGKFLQGALKSNPMPNANPMINRGIREGVLPTWSQGPQALGQMGRVASGTNALDRNGLAGAIKGYRKEIRPNLDVTHNKVGTQVGQMPLKMPGLSMKPPGIQKGVLGMNPAQLNAARPGVTPVGKSTGTAVKAPVAPVSPVSPVTQNTAGQQG